MFSIQAKHVCVHRKLSADEDGEKFKEALVDEHEDLVCDSKSLDELCEVAELEILSSSGLSFE